MQKGGTRSGIRNRTNGVDSETRRSEHHRNAVAAVRPTLGVERVTDWTRARRVRDAKAEGDVEVLREVDGVVEPHSTYSLGEVKLNMKTCPYRV